MSLPVKGDLAIDGKVTATNLIDAVRLSFDGGGGAPAAGTKVWAEVPVAGTIVGYTLVSDAAGSCVLTVKKYTYANFPATPTDLVGGGAAPTLSSAQKAQDNTLASWTTTVNAGDLIEVGVTSASTLTRILLSIRIKRT